MGIEKSLKYLLLVLAICIIIPMKVNAENIKSSDLIDNAYEFDGKTIIYSGEVIGDIMKRGDYAWINVSDGDNAIGIWVPYSETEKIQYAGSYGFKGDTISVTGTFNRACAEHGGDFDIHSENIDILQKGVTVPRTVDKWKIYAAVLTLSAGAVLLVVMLRKRI